MPDMNAVAMAPAFRRAGIGLALLFLVTGLAYVPSLGGGFLNWDDPWLLESNPAWRNPSLSTLCKIWCDFTLSTRVAFGAEYLPVRDTSYLVEAWLHGLRPLPMRLVNLALYLLVLGVLYRPLRIVLRREALALLALAGFALHPCHAESVAWLAGRKDLLAMLFMALALRAYAGRGSRAAIWVAVYSLLAMLSKSMSVVLPLMSLLVDVGLRRRPRVHALAASAAVIALALSLELYVGDRVGMIQPQPRGGIGTSLATMGTVWLRYLRLLLWPLDCSLIHDVPTEQAWTFAAIGGYFTVFACLGWALWRWRRGKSGWFVGWCLLWVPLLPVSQIFAPLQNRMADRYLWWSVMAVALLLVWLVQRWPRAGGVVAGGLLVFWTVVTAERAALFGDSALVFADATRKTRLSGVAPYQLAMALETEGNIAGARAAYELAWRRTEGRSDVSRRATNNLARLEAREGNLSRAEAVLLRGLANFPNDAKMRSNLDLVRGRLHVDEPSKNSP